MTKEFEAIIRLAVAGSFGYPVTVLPKELDWLKIEKQSKEHSVQTLVGYALRNAKISDIPVEICQRMICDMRNSAFSNNAWREKTLKLLEEMKKEGISVILVKGYAVASCYSSPDCRLSGDTDLLIPIDCEKKAYKFMQSKGFHVEPRWKHGHHGVCGNREYGNIELHIKLYDEIVEDVWFKNVEENELICEPYIKESIEGRSFTTLGKTDHAIFLILHLIKHFIMTGLSIRMMLDIVLFLIKNKTEIDFDRFWKVLKDLRFEKIAQSIIWSIRKFSEEEFELPGMQRNCPDEIEHILDDLEKGGWLGYDEKRTREEGWYEFNRQLITKRKGRMYYILYMIYWKAGRYIYVLFPTQKQLAKKYPWVEKSVLYVPIAWIPYVIYRLKRAAKRGSFTSEIVTNEKEINDIALGRIELFKEMDML